MKCQKNYNQNQCKRKENKKNTFPSKIQSFSIILFRKILFIIHDNFTILFKKKKKIIDISGVELESKSTQ